MSLFHHKKAALVTGGGKRIGAYIVNVVAQNNYDIIIHCNNSKDDALKTKFNIENKYSVKVEVLCCDFFKFNSLDAFIADAFDVFPHLNTLINNASIFKKINYINTKEDIFDQHMDIHVKIPFFLSKKFIEKRSTNVINIIDEFILKKSSENYFSYLLSKKALMVLTEMLEVEFKKTNSIINAIIPKKILCENGIYSKESFLLQKALKYLLCTKESGMKIYI